MKFEAINARIKIIAEKLGCDYDKTSIIASLDEIITTLKAYDFLNRRTLRYASDCEKTLALVAQHLGIKLERRNIRGLLRINTTKANKDLILAIHNRFAFETFIDDMTEGLKP